MSRRLVIGILVVLILGVIGGTVVLVVSRLRSSSETSDSTTSTGAGSLTEADSGRQTVVDPTGDDDGDGLSNSDEVLWGTDRTNPDTDGDGFLDGEEVAASHNPTIASPNDLLPPGFQPGREITPLDVAPIAAEEFGQLFEGDIDFSGPSGNLTDRYNREYDENEQTPETLRNFLVELPVVTRLPTPTNDAVQLAPAASPQLLDQYLSSTGDISIFSLQALFRTALNDTFGRGDTSTMQGLIIMMEAHQARLAAATVPPEAEQLHRLSLGYSEFLAHTFNQIAGYNEDSVRSFLGVRQWETADKTYVPLIEQEYARLQEL